MSVFTYMATWCDNQEYHNPEILSRKHHSNLISVYRQVLLKFISNCRSASTAVVYQILC